ncbi:MAG: 6,7-dimethyl-8-ribityllumazine synthase [Verrucomicrobia bacterium]|nr:6,7-dimethyl-8-ribityllumazine synthase [Verrucomicrobiota bacterium]
MLRILPARPRTNVVGAKHQFAFVASQYNPELVQGLVNGAAAEINASMPAATLVLHQVPGAFEIPLAVQELTRSNQGVNHAIIAFGVVLQGQTFHAELVARAVTDALMRIGLEARIPVVHCVLHCDTIEQARVRCLEEGTNRGVEGARAAMQMVQMMEEMRGVQS